MAEVEGGRSSRYSSQVSLSPRPVADTKPCPPFLVSERVLMLQKMVCDLEKINRNLRVEESPPLTIEEQSVIALILGHVELDIFLAQREAHSKFLQSCDDAQLKFEELRKETEKKHLGIGPPFVDLNLTPSRMEGGDSVPDGAAANHMIDAICEAWYKVFDSFYDFDSFHKCPHQVNDFVKPKIMEPIDMGIDSAGKKQHEGLSSYSNARSIIEDVAMVSNVTGPLAEKGVVKSQELSDSNLKTREEFFKEILCRLESMRTMRAYAPPENDELKCYREIRKWINAVISYIRAKVSVRKDRCTNIVAGNRKWISVFHTPFDCSCVFNAPYGHKLAFALDKLPELLLLLRNFKEWALEISSNFKVKKSSTYAMDCMDDIELGVADDALSQGWETIKKRKGWATCITQYGSNKRRQFSHTAEDNEANTSMREKNLLNILSLFLKIESLCIDGSPSFLEVRLYAQVLEHVNSSFWVFQEHNDFEKSGEIEEFCEMSDIVSRNSSDQVHDSSGDQIWNEEVRTRVQYLEEAVYLVDAIKASYRCTVPTVREMVLYGKLTKHVRDDFLQSGCNWKPGSMDIFYSAGAAWEGTPEQVAHLRDLMKAVYDKEIEIFRMIQKDRLHVEKAFKGLKEEGFVFTCQEEWDSLGDRMVLVFFEVSNLFESYSYELGEANRCLHLLLDGIQSSRDAADAACEVQNALITVSAVDC